MKAVNIYMCGVGGQGIGLLAEVMIRATMAAGYTVKGVDTHGLAQRGGTVVSHLRIGDGIFSPLVPPGEADLVLALERLEAYRATLEMLKDGGNVLYYDAVYQPIHVRLGETEYPPPQDLEKAVQKKRGKLERVFVEDLPDARMQNIILLARIGQLEWIPGLDLPCVEGSLRSVLPARIAEENLRLFRRMSH